jgi:serine/threonine protein kinase, bacterial
MRRVLLILFLLCWCISVALASGGSGAGSRDNWGALAYSDSTGRYGFAYDYASQAQAINAAVERCKARDCRGVVWFRNSCGAFAKGNGAYGWGIGDSRGLAEAKALAECRKRGGGCRIIQWACTSR